jgi:hypothetical protein
LRGTQSASELRALQKRVVEGLVASSTERTEATGRGFQDTGSTVKAFDGEEVDWYVCNVASYHVKQSIDPSLLLVENEDLKRWLLLDDEMLMRAVAVAVGQVDLESLLAHYSTAEEWVEAARVTRAISTVSAARSDRVKHARAALALLEQAGSETTEAQQLELDIRGSLQYTMLGPEKKQNGARMQALMAQNKSLQADSLGLYFVLMWPRLIPLFGGHPKSWDAGQIATQDTVREGFRLQMNEGVALFAKAVEECVGARKECIRIGYELVCCCTHFMSCRSTDETAGMHQQLLEEKWGDDGSILLAACMDYRFDRHFMISQGIGCRMDSYLFHPHARGAVEYSGNVQQMVQLFEKQQGDMREFVKRGVPGMELPYYCRDTAFSFTGSDFKALHPFGKDLLTLFESCEGQCTDPSDCEGWYESADYSVFVARYSGGTSSKDGLHHHFLKSYIISTNQATLSLLLASMGASNFDLSWLNSLPAPDDPTLHDGTTYMRFTNLCALAAEVLEWQGRYKEANRCANSHSSLLLLTLSYSLMHFLLLVQSQLCRCRIARLFQLQRIIEGARRTGDRALPCGVGRACPLSVGIRRSNRAGKAWALPSIRGADHPRSGTGGARGRRE